MPCEGSKPRWIAFRYESLDEYCTSCGLIGHNKKVYPAPQEQTSPDKYKKPLRASTYVSPRLVVKLQQEDSNSEISLAASVGNSPSSMSLSHLLDSPCSSFGQIVPRNVNQINSLASSTNMFRLQHVDSLITSVHS